MSRNQKYSIRKACILRGGFCCFHSTIELWLNKDGQWGHYKNRKTFADQDAAEKFVEKIFGSDFQAYGIF